MYSFISKLHKLTFTGKGIKRITKQQTSAFYSAK